MDLQARSDEELLALTGADPAAFEVLYRRYFSLMTGYFVNRTRNPELAADLTAETFAGLLTTIRTFDPARGPFKAWLFGIANRKLVDSMRQGEVETRGRQRLGLARLELTDADLERIDQSGERPEVAALIAELPEDQRAAVTGRVIGEQTYAELATELRCSEAVVRQRVSRGLRALRQLLEGTS
jgi:RNA polymerase sigma-70 factor (ECF subfamily)